MTCKDNPSLVDWKALSEDLKDQNRAQAEFFISHLHQFGYVVATKYRWDDGVEPLDDNTVLEMAKLEHMRYWQMKEAQGYHLGDVTDPVKKTNRTLKPWDQLDGVDQQKDIRAIQGLPERLAKVYLRLERIN